ncbi:MAG TPA: protease [Legionellales bacterium]|nr:protease [Legionellales bacterium]
MKSLSPMLTQIMPAIVNVSVQGKAPGQFIIPEQYMQQVNPNTPPPPELLRPRPFSSIGSGVVVDPKNGIVVTNSHVIRNAEIITITLMDGRHLKARKIGEDPSTDIAVLQIKPERLQSLPIGDSDKVKVGDFVVAIGNPFGLNSYGNSQSATFGIVSAMKRSDINLEGVESFIQTDAAINPGNSGGALVTTQGELIGINTGIVSPSGGNVGIGFAIPINMVRDVTQQILQFGSVQRGIMGIFVQHLTPELAIAMGYNQEQQGALIAQVNQGSTAEQAGLHTGDIITKINDTTITQASQVKATISLLRSGTQAKIYILRNGQAKAINVMVSDIRQFEQQLQATNPFLFGLALGNFEQDAPPNGMVQGVQVRGVLENTSGFRAGLKPGDVIISANRKPVTKIESLQQIAKSSQKQLLLQVLRGDGALFVLLD